MSNLSSKFKALLAALAYRSGAFLLIRLLHRHIFGSGIKIIYYHRVAASASDADSLGRQLLTAREFDHHLSHLRRFYNVISLGEARQVLASLQAPPRNRVVITFDDGYRDNLTVALPLLEKHALPASLFVVTGALDGQPLWLDLVNFWFRTSVVSSLRFSLLPSELTLNSALSRRKALALVRSVLKSLPGSQLPQALGELRTQLQITGPDRQPDDSPVLTWDELRRMSSSPLMTIGAHTKHHPILPNLEPGEMQSEIIASCQRLSKQLRQPVRFFAYPGGAYNAVAQSIVRKAGLMGCATGGGGFNPAGSDLTALRRLGVEGMTRAQFALHLSGWEDLRELLSRKLARSRRALKRMAYRVLESIGVFPLLRYLNDRRILVLLYHGVSSSPSASGLNDLHVPADQFRRQMRWLRRHFTTIPLAQVIAALDGRAPWPRRAALVTFDDGYHNNLDVAWPILKELGIQPTLFAPTSFMDNDQLAWTEALETRIRTTRALGVRFRYSWLWLRNLDERKAAFSSISSVLKTLSPADRDHARKEIQDQLALFGDTASPATPEPRLTWAELRALREQGMDIGSHTISHALLPGMSVREVQRELADSKKHLESRLGVPILSFAYPNGDWNLEVQHQVQAAGYTCAFSARPGLNGPLTNRFLLHRVPINANDSFGEFLGAVSGFSRCGMQPPSKILEISNYPPPECGWARQTKLLAEELACRGAVCEVMNINESRKLKNAQYVDVQNGADYLLKVLSFALRRYRLHTHVNAESKKGYLLTLAANLIARAVGRPAVMTFHGGLPQTYFPRMDSRFLKWAYRLLFASAGSILCNSGEIRRAIQSYGTNGQPIVAVPGFSHQYLKFQQRELPDATEAFLSRHHPVFFCFVCFRPEYALDALLDAMQNFTRFDPDAGFIWLGFPAKELSQVEAYLNSHDRGRPENLLLLGNLDHDSFLSLLSRCTAYVRPPACDGVSASVLESLALQVPVIAAENGRRPPGVVTFRFADSSDLCSKLQYVTENYDTVKNATQLQDVEDNIQRTASWLIARDISEESLVDARTVQN